MLTKLHGAMRSLGASGCQPAVGRPCIEHGVAHIWGFLTGTHPEECVECKLTQRAELCSQTPPRAASQEAPVAPSSPFSTLMLVSNATGQFPSFELTQDIMHTLVCCVWFLTPYTLGVECFSKAWTKHKPRFGSQFSCLQPCDFR